MALCNLPVRQAQIVPQESLDPNTHCERLALFNEDGTPYTPSGGSEGGASTFLLAGDSGTSLTISDGNTLTVTGGDGIDTVVSATDRVTVAVDSTVARDSDVSAAQSAAIAAAAALVDDLSGVSNQAAARTNIGVITATEAAEGLVEYATNAETLLGTATNRATHPAGVKAAIDAAVLAGGGSGPASETTAGIVEYATSAETVVGTSNVLATHPQGVKAAVDAAITALVGTAPAALNTLGELSDALADDANYAASITTALSNKQPLDGTLTALAGQTVAANQFLYATGADAFTPTGLSADARTMLAAATFALMRSALGVYGTADVITNANLPVAVALDLWQTSGGVWPARNTVTSSSTRRVNFITYFGIATEPTDYIDGVDSITYRSA